MAHWRMGARLATPSLISPTDVGEEGRELEAMMVMPTCGRRTCRKRSGMASQWPRVGSMRSAMAMALEGARVELAQEEARKKVARVEGEKGPDEGRRAP